MSAIRIISDSEEKTEAAGERLARLFTSGGVIAMYGGLGAGKTAFVRGLARGLGIGARISSPTFTIVNEYHEGRLRLCHFDMYRLGGADELYDIGWEDYMDGETLCAVEWSENVESALPEDAVRVLITVLSDTEREILISGGLI